MASRRRFLSLIVAAPAALPVIAKEAAAKLGLEGILGGSVSHGAMLAVPAGGPIDSTIGDSRAKRALKRFWAPSAKRERRSSVEWQARRLDPDLASMRSISPAAAYQLQRARCAVRIEQDSLTSLREHIEEEAANRLGL